MQKTGRGASLFGGLPPRYWLLWAGTLINRLGGFVLPFLTLYLTGQRNIPVSQAAFMVSLLGAGSFVSQLTGGELSDRLGRRPIMLMSFFATPAVMLSLGFARDLALIGVCTLLLGFFMDLYRPAMSASVADLVAPERRTRAYGYIYWAINLGAALAPIAAGFMARTSYVTLFIADAASTFIFGLIVLFGLRETRPPEAAQHAAHAGIGERVHELGRVPVLLIFSCIGLFFGMIYSQGMVTLPLDMAAHGLQPSQYGIAIAVNGFLIVLAAIPISNLAGRWPRLPAIALAAVFLGLGFGFTALASSLPFYMVSVGIWTLGEIIGSSVAPTIVADLAPIELRGLFQGISGASWGLAFFVGPLLGGWIYQKFGAHVLWLGSFAVGMAASLAYIALGRFATSRAVAREKAA